MRRWFEGGQRVRPHTHVPQDWQRQLADEAAAGEGQGEGGGGEGSAGIEVEEESGEDEADEELEDEDEEDGQFLRLRSLLRKTLLSVAHYKWAQDTKGSLPGQHHRLSFPHARTLLLGIAPACWTPSFASGKGGAAVALRVSLVVYVCLSALCASVLCVPCAQLLGARDRDGGESGVRVRGRHPHALETRRPPGRGPRVRTVYHPTIPSQLAAPNCLDASSAPSPHFSLLRIPSA